jgi:DNA invertase Pin-like site-specific DNA recombinase
MNTTPEGQDSVEQANLSLYFHAIDDLQPGDAVILCLRVSKRAQKKTGNLEDQKRHLRRVVAERGARVVGLIPHEGPGWDFSWLIPALAKAKECGAKLLAESVSRFVRSKEYHSSKNPESQPSELQLESLRVLSDGVSLVTALDPNASPAEERSWQTKRGQMFKDRRGGRPLSNSPGYKLALRHRLKPLARQMRADGASVGEIVKHTGVARSTVRDWVRYVKTPGRIFATDDHHTQPDRGSNPTAHDTQRRSSAGGKPLVPDAVQPKPCT